MTPTTVQYTLNRNDLFRSRVRGLFANKSLYVFATIPGAITAWSELTDPAKSRLPLLVKIIVTLLVVCFVFGSGLLAGLFILFAGVRKANTGILCEHTIELTDDGLLERTETNESIHRWSGIHKLITTKDYIYVYVTDTSYHQIPLRAFTSPEHLAGFKSEISRRATIST